MNNPFKFGTIVENEFFTDRKKECEYITRFIGGQNHLILISPRRYGKSSLVHKAIKESGRQYIVLNMQNVTSVENFAARLMKAIFSMFPMEHIRHLMTHFRIVPTISTNMISGTIDVSFMPNVDTSVLLEDALSLLEKVSSSEERIVVVLDEFQEILNIQKGFDQQLRAIMQEQQSINYIFLGSQESMMEGIFEKKKSPFYHFGQLMRLNKIPREDFHAYISSKLPHNIANDILDFTKCHPYYTQQLAYHVWDIINYEGVTENILHETINRIITLHDLDYERLWLSFKKQERRVMMTVANGNGHSLMKDHSVPTSTTFSTIKKLMQNGFLVKDSTYEIEDPFFSHWIVKMQNN